MYRCEAATKQGGRCKGKASEYVPHGGLEYLVCKRHLAEMRRGMSFVPAPGTGQPLAEDKKNNLKKPDISAALKFAEGDSKGSGEKVPHKADIEAKNRSGLVPDGDVRLNANVRRDLHMRIKIEAARQGRTLGELIEELIDKNMPKL